jgi:hypothetical protein
VLIIQWIRLLEYQIVDMANSKCHAFHCMLDTCHASFVRSSLSSQQAFANGSQEQMLECSATVAPEILVATLRGSGIPFLVFHETFLPISNLSDTGRRIFVGCMLGTSPTHFTVTSRQ